MEITVYGQQWWWSYEYDLDPDEDDGPEIITANDLVIPVGSDVTLNLESRDVIHSFWIPALNGTRDVVPGRTHSPRPPGRRARHLRRPVQGVLRAVARQHEASASSPSRWTTS